MTKKPTLREAMKDPKGYKEHQEQSLAEANLEQAELSKMDRIISAFGPDVERETELVELTPGIEILVYSQLTGEEEQALGVLNSESLKFQAWKKRQKKGKEPNLGNFLDNLIGMCANICAEEDIDGLDPDEFFRELHKKVGSEKLTDILQIMLKPFEEHQEKVKKFRSDNRRG